MTNKSSTSSSSPLNSAAASALGPAPSDLAITLDVEPRKPRLAWQGMERKELAGAVPTQVVEIVRPGRAVERKEELDLGARAAAARAELVRPDNRLIWTNDNLVALQTLLDERDPKTKDYRYRGKVDLVYIDPPFMVNNDFRADNAIDIELDDKAHVQARKEPSLVEIIAYKDTWRQGLDSFVSMLRARLVVLKQLLAPTGSIYVHLDWHASHYVKVLMDEIFGYECFQNEIIWKRTSSHNRTRRWGPVHDAILFYSVSDKFTWNRVLQEYDASYTDNFYRNVDARGKYAVDNLTGPGSRAGPSGLPWRRFFGRSARQSRFVERKAMIDPAHDLSITKQAEALNISRGSVYYLPGLVPDADLLDDPSRILRLEDEQPVLEANPELTRPISHQMYLPTPVVFTTGVADAGDHYIVASGEADLACRITHIPKALFA